MPRESALVRKIIAAVRKKCPRAYVRKIADRFNRGIPDILIIFPRLTDVAGLTYATTLFVETKTKDGKLSKIQEEEHKAITGVGSFGCSVIVARDVDHVIGELQARGMQ